MFLDLHVLAVLSLTFCLVVGLVGCAKCVPGDLLKDAYIVSVAQLWLPMHLTQTGRLAEFNSFALTYIYALR